MEQKLFAQLKKITKQKRRRPVEDIHRSMDIVEHILRDSDDLNITAMVVTTSLRLMKENPKMDISDAIVLAYEECIK